MAPRVCARGRAPNQIVAARLRPLGIAHGRPPSLMDAAELSVVAWGEVTSTTISNCFRKANLGVVYCNNSDASASVVSGVASNDDTDIDDIMHTGEMVSLLLADLRTGA